MPEISIILPGYNVERYLYSCMSSIIDSTFKDYELIYVDDCSTDKSKEIAASFNCQVLSTKENSGPSITRNLGAKNANGKYLLFIDADTTIPRDAIENIYSMLKGRDRVVICGRYSKEPLNKGFFQKYYCLFKYFIQRTIFH
mgnify:CR=1 FL=1